MSNAKLTEEQWAGFGRFQRLLAERLDVEWTMEFSHYDRPHPFVEVKLRVPVARHFQSLDESVVAAFDEANVPGYENSGFGHDPDPVDGVITRDLDFHIIESAA